MPFDRSSISHHFLWLYQYFIQPCMTIFMRKLVKVSGYANGSRTRTQAHVDVGELAGYKKHMETTWRIAFFGINTIHFQILYKGMSVNIKRFPIDVYSTPHGIV